jgi:hypothetical protein
MRGKEGQGLCCILVNPKLVENTGFLIGNGVKPTPIAGVMLASTMLL